MSFTTTALLLTWVALVLLALVVAGLVRQVHHLTQGPRTRDVGPSAGTAAPGLDRLAAEPGQPTLLLFLEQDCPACQDVFAEALTLTGGPPTRAVFAGDAPAADPPPALRILANQDALFQAYRIPATPFGVVVGADGRVRTAEPVGSVRALHDLVAEAGGRYDAELATHAQGGRSGRRD
jgi:hypothetical protein